MNFERLYKTRPRGVFSDPITGTIRKFETQPKAIEGLDTRINKDRFPHHLSSEIHELQQNNGYSQKDRISGALRKEVRTLTYVNPYQLKSTNSPVLRTKLDPQFEQSSRKFYEVN